ncbi:MAG: beta-ketoacyl synthase chain length factor [Candidatus Thiodiazotropha sp.]
MASTEGDLEIINQICIALTQSGRPVSPTLFHNSVHNAPAGYWSIATGYHQASTSLGGMQGTLAAGLLEAAVQSIAEGSPVLLVAYDHRSPAPLNQLIEGETTFALALLISGDPDGAGRLATLHLETLPDIGQTTLQTPALERLRCSVPIARGLPLLQAIARRQAATLDLPYLPELGLRLVLVPC